MMSEFPEQNDDNENAANNGGADEASEFPPGEHPLDNIPGVNPSDLPTPDPLPSNIEGYPLDLLGPYIIRCLHSKTWSLREAALAKASIVGERALRKTRNIYEPLLNQPTQFVFVPFFARPSFRPENQLIGPHRTGQSPGALQRHQGWNTGQDCAGHAHKLERFAGLRKRVECRRA